MLCNVTPNAAKANKEIILVSLVLFICDLGTRERNRKRCVAQFKISGASHFSAGSLRNSGAMSPLVELIDLLAATVTSSRGIFNDDIVVWECETEKPRKLRRLQSRLEKAVSAAKEREDRKNISTTDEH